MKTYHTKIKVTTIANNGSERFGANAECKMWREGSVKMDISMFGETKAIAEKKLIDFLSDYGETEIECV